MKIHDGESEMPIDVWSMVVKIWNKGDALDKLMVEGCPKQTDKKGDALDKMTEGGCPKQDDRRGMS